MNGERQDIARKDIVKNPRTKATSRMHQNLPSLQRSGGV